MPKNTLAALESIEHLGEVARLIFVFTRRGLQRMEEPALVDACKRTAGLSGRYPRPKPALALALSLGLLQLHNNFVTLTDTGRTFSSTGNSFGLELSQGQKQLLLGALLDDDTVENGIKLLLNNFQVLRGELLARKNAISSDPRQLLFCRLLQQIGAIQVSGDYFVLIRPFDRIVERLVIHSARLSQDELWERLELQRERGQLAEEKVVEVEKLRLSSANRADLAAKVKRISVEDVSAGFDVKSFESDESPRYIEVKSSVGSQIVFEWSQGERAKAHQEGLAFYIYFVPFSFSLPTLTSPIVIIRNPVEQISTGALIEAPSNYKVMENRGLGAENAAELKIKKSMSAGKLVVFGQSNARR